jgi:predicted transcriptional regulator
MENLLGFVVANLQQTKGTWQEVAKGSGVPYSTIKKVANPAVNSGTKSPRIETVQKLADYFQEQGAA